MRRRAAPQARVPRSAALAVALLLVGLLIASQATAVTSVRERRARQVRVPSCKRLSTAAMAKVLGFERLVFKFKKGNLCDWEAKKPHHYHEVLVVQVIPGIKSIYQLAKADGMKTAAKEGEYFGTLTASRHSPWKAAFFITVTRTDAGLEPCPPKHKLPPFGPPQCSPDPDWTFANVYSYSPSMMVSLSASAQQGDVHLSHAIELNKEILDRQIR